MSKVTLHNSGDAGDANYCLPILKHLGGGDFVMGNRPYTKFITYFDTLKPLFESQEYVHNFRWEIPEEEFTHFTSSFRPPREPGPLAMLMAKHVNAWPCDLKSPWLTVKPNPNGRVIIHRSQRYRNDNFPWQKIVDFYGDRLLMVGFPHEWEEFTRSFGRVEFYQIKDFLDLAEIIAGSFLAIMNQSSPNSIAEGLKHRRLIEVCAWTPDTAMGGGDVQYCYNGYCTLPHPTESPLVIAPPVKHLRDRNCGIPGGFNFEKDGKEFIAGNFNALMARARKAFPLLTEEEVDIYLATKLSSPFVEEVRGDFSLVKHVFGLAGIPYP